MSNGELEGYTIPRGDGEKQDVIDIDPNVSDVVQNDDATQFVLDVLGGLDPSGKPLGDGFQSKYKVEVDGVERDVSAEQYLTAQGYDFVYFPYQAGEAARDIEPAVRVLLKNQMASVGLLDLTKTQGAMVDEEFVKGIRRLMEFSMNNGGKLDWLQSLGVLRTNFSVRKAVKTTSPKIDNEQMDDIVDDLLTKAKSRKGAPLNAEERNYISNKIQQRLDMFNTEIEGLKPATSGNLVFDPTNPLQGTYLPPEPGEQPDTEQLAEDLSDIEEEVFAPREEAARQQEVGEQIRSRGARTVSNLTNLFRAGVKR